MEPGIHKTMTMEAYHRSPGLSNSGLKAFAKTPEHYKSYLQEMTFDEPASLFTLVHLRVLEPESFTQKVKVIDGNRNKTSVKDEIAHARIEGFEVTKSKTYDKVQLIASKIMNHPTAKFVLGGDDSDGISEASIFWNDDASGTGILRKCRPDRIRPKAGVIVDLKGYSDLTTESLESQINRQKYHWQAAFHLEGVSSVLGFKTDKIVYVFYEDEPPYGVRVVALNAAAIEKAQEDYKPILETYANCLKSDMWPGYTEAMDDVSIPHWAWS